MDKWLEILKLAAPIAFLTIPGAQALMPLAPLIVTTIAHAQTFAQPGVEKKAMVMTSVSDAIAITNAAAGKVVIDPTTGVTLSGHVVDAIVDSTNRFHDVAEKAAAAA